MDNFPKELPTLKDPKMPYSKWLIATHNNTLWKKIMWAAYLPYKFAYLCGILLFSYKYWGHFNLLIGVLVTFPVSFQGLIKSIILVTKKNRIMSLLARTESTFWDTSISKGRHFEYAMTRYRFVDFIIKNHSFMGFGAFVCACVFPAAKYPEGVKQLPGIFWAPFDTNQTPIYEILCLILTCNNFMGFFSSLIYEVIFVYISEHLCGQFIMLQYCLENFVTWNNKDNITSDKDNKEFNRRMGIMVEHHNRLLNFCQELEGLISWSMITQIPIATACLFSSGYFLSTNLSDDIAMSFNLALYGIVVTVELSLYCFYGSQIEQESYIIRDAAYASNWSDGNISTQKSVQILMMNVGDGIRFSAGGMIPLNNNTVVSVFRTVFSCITLLQQMNENVENRNN